MAFDARYDCEVEAIDSLIDGRVRRLRVSVLAMLEKFT